MLHAFGVTDKGRVRPTNEDCFGIAPELQLCVVADGMGGHKAGEVAARIAVDAVLDYVSSNAAMDTWPYGYDHAVSARANLLRTAVQVANTRVYEAAAAADAHSGMGTTLVALLVEERVLTVAHVGDSRLYAFTDGRVEQLTRDDSWVAAMLAQDPTLSPSVLSTHPMRHALTSVVGGRAQVDVHIGERAIGGRDLLVITTDGVHGVLGDASLARECGATGELAEIAARLVQAAMDTGSRDNCTAVVARYERD